MRFPSETALSKIRATTVPAPPNAHNFLRVFFKPGSRIGPRARRCRRAVALNLEVFGRGLAAIGNLFVLDGLPFIECRKTSFLNCRNVNEHVLATVAGLDESIALGRIEPLHRTFSHSRRLRGIKKRKRTAGPRTYRHARAVRIRGLGRTG